MTKPVLRMRVEHPANDAMRLVPYLAAYAPPPDDVSLAQVRKYIQPRRRQKERARARS